MILAEDHHFLLIFTKNLGKLLDWNDAYIQLILPWFLNKTTTISSLLPCLLNASCQPTIRELFQLFSSGRNEADTSFTLCRSLRVVVGHWIWLFFNYCFPFITINFYGFNINGHPELHVHFGGELVLF